MTNYSNAPQTEVAQCAHRHATKLRLTESNRPCLTGAHRELDAADCL